MNFKRKRCGKPVVVRDESIFGNGAAADRSREREGAILRLCSPTVAAPKFQTAVGSHPEIMKCFGARSVLCAGVAAGSPELFTPTRKCTLSGSEDLGGGSDST
jgi:hypothetical protein